MCVVLCTNSFDVIFPQACRGGRFDYGVESETVDAPDTPPIPDEEMKELMEEQVSTGPVNEMALPGSHIALCLHCLAPHSMTRSLKRPWMTMI